MKVKVKDLEANPYRNLKKYPLDSKKINDLIISIKRNDFWGGLLVREHPTKPGKYQLAFGHHRWAALKKLGYEWADDTIVRKLSDDDMHHRMFAENHETWGARPSCVLENVESARNRLNSILETNTWETSGDFTRGLFDGQRGFDTAKGMGAGRSVILKYLGGLYNENQVKHALNMLKEGESPNGEISLEAVKHLPTLSHAEHFRRAAKEHKIPKEKQEKIAKEVVEEGVGRRGVAGIVAKHSFTPPEKPKIAEQDKPYLRIQNLVAEIDAGGRTLFNKIKLLRSLIKEYEVTDLKGLKVSLLRASLKKLSGEIQRLNGKE
jgi:ParB-like chromosome segregation protein Spo0J